MTYVQPHFRYGALSYIEPNSDKETANTKFKKFQSKYNKTWKIVMKIPNKTRTGDMDKLLGTQSARMLTYSSYLIAYNK